MRLLLDTSVLLWWALGDERLSPRGRALLEDDANRISASVITIWETAIKNATGRGDLPGMSARGLIALIDDGGFPLLPLVPDHVRALEGLPMLHRDPFDRILVAQARAENMRLVTQDRALAGYGETVLAV